MAKNDTAETLLKQLQRYRGLMRHADDSLLWNGIRKQIELIETKLARLDPELRAEAEAAAAERRASDRITAKIRGRIAGGSGSMAIETVDLSSGGALLRAKGAEDNVPLIVPGDAVTVALSGIGELHGQVVAKNGLGLHLRFTEEGISPRERLVRAIDRLNQFEGKFIDAAQTIAAEIGTAFESAVEHGMIALDDLFDRDYRPIAGTNPAEYLTKYAELAAELLPPLLEPALELDDSVVFCSASDLNGYLPADRRRYPRRGGGTPAPSRGRRIDDDAISLTAARNRRAFLLQSHRSGARDGAAQLREVDSPITVTGRHWGGLRLGFRV